MTGRPPLNYNIPNAMSKQASVNLCVGLDSSRSMTTRPPTHLLRIDAPEPRTEFRMKAGERPAE